jgi:rhamnogalacturonyl hydrolase YesR
MKTLALMVWLASTVCPQLQAAADGAAPQTSRPSAEISPAPILATLKLVADWQLAHPTTSKERFGEQAWTYGALYTGIMALGEIAGTPKYHDAMVAMGKKFNWSPAPRRYYADDQCVSQTYLELYLKEFNLAMLEGTTQTVNLADPGKYSRDLDRALTMLEPTKTNFDYILEHPKTNDLHMGVRGAQDRWNWCDALFMAPPAWARLYKATGDQRYLDFLHAEWKATSDFLYDTNEHLFFRDSTYFDKREANGKKIFWSRGNGWVMAGLARVLPMLPPEDPRRKFYEQQFKEMAAKIITLQQDDGLWRSSLLDPEAYPLKETSGSSFYTFALTWGINNGLLDRTIYEPVVRKAWKALVECVTPEGKLEHVQPVGADPKKFDPGSTDVFGTGAFLLAGSEMYRLAQHPPAK